MSRRQLCHKCQRPLRTCLCKHVQKVANLVEVIILQHPAEVGEAKNSGDLLHFCLDNSQIFRGETFDDAFFKGFSWGHRCDLLLYPSTPEEKSLGILPSAEMEPASLTTADNLQGLRSLRLWILDATWRKSRKMLYLNPQLQQMPRFSLRDCPPSIYKIRKAHSENQLSTLEASCYALRQLEHNLVSYAPVLEAFANFVAEQYHFLPDSFSQSHRETL